jgi:hypothetical protein
MYRGTVASNACIKKYVCMYAKETVYKYMGRQVRLVPHLPFAIWPLLIRILLGLTVGIQPLVSKIYAFGETLFESCRSIIS